MSFKNFLRSEKGATAVEYGLIAAGIALTIAATIFAFGDTLYDLFYDGLSTLLG